jgi:ferrochelatase
MRYGSPSIASQLDALQAEGANRVLVLPAYPQYSATTTASIVDAVGAWSAGQRNLPELRFVNRYHDDSGYVQALVRRIERHWREHGPSQHLVMSFHGVPERTLQLGDPYHCECQKTARLTAARLGLPKEKYSVTFQSRFGKAKWLEPYTEPTLRALAKGGLSRVDVVCPGFTGDCLETLEEIAMEGRHAFLSSGGKEFHYIPCLNDEPAWISALGQLAERNLAGWPTREAPDADQLAASRRAALAMGAKQ